MACLSVFRENKKGAVVAANPIYIVYPPADLKRATLLKFEMLEADASMLSHMVGEYNYYAIGSDIAFWGILKSLVPCQSTASGLALLRDKPSLMGVIEMYDDEPAQH